MDCMLPSPAVGFFWGKTGIVAPSLVEEFLGPVLRPAPHERRNRINDFSQWAFPLLDLLKRVFHCFSAHHPKLSIIGFRLEPASVSSQLTCAGGLEMTVRRT